MMTPIKREADLSTYAGRFAARLRELREKAGLSQAELAEKTGSKQRSVSNWETGTTQPSFNQLPLLADALKTSVRNLMPKE
ncbi:MAG: helix-turn-helix transcriptional regulator [Thermoguttaceae bacterium]|nr:helix-turn-helix transcriptional regulator [Thermoguttaceae bacterium]MBP3532645.1 helix-turn-helix transcriptional regulator [Thermoguttaceae bacterium]